MEVLGILVCIVLCGFKYLTVLLVVVLYTPPPTVVEIIRTLVLMVNSFPSVTGHNFLKVSWSSVKGMKLYLVEKRALHE